MNAANRHLPTSPASPHKGGQHLQSLFEGARETVEAIFSRMKPEHSSTRIYWAMEKLHSNYPHLSQGELEALLMGVLKQSGTKPDR